MIIWVTGERGKGKTTLAKTLQSKMGGLLLDGDQMRESISKDLGYDEKDRLENNLRIARLAKILHEQGNDVIVATICPEYVRQEVYWVCKCTFIHL